MYSVRMSYSFAPANKEARFASTFNCPYVQIKARQVNHMSTNTGQNRVALSLIWPIASNLPEEARQRIPIDSSKEICSGKSLSGSMVRLSGGTRIDGM